LIGDPQQIDHPLLDERTNGLSYAAEKMKAVALFPAQHAAGRMRTLPLALDAAQRMVGGSRPEKPSCPANTRPPAGFPSDQKELSILHFACGIESSFHDTKFISSSGDPGFPSAVSLHCWDPAAERLLLLFPF
jgi:hypothetical protein